MATALSPVWTWVCYYSDSSGQLGACSLPASLSGGKRSKGWQNTCEMTLWICPDILNWEGRKRKTEDKKKNYCRSRRLCGTARQGPSLCGQSRHFIFNQKNGSQTRPWWPTVYSVFCATNLSIHLQLLEMCLCSTVIFSLTYNLHNGG